MFARFSVDSRPPPDPGEQEARVDLRAEPHPPPRQGSRRDARGDAPADPLRRARDDPRPRRVQAPEPGPDQGVLRRRPEGELFREARDGRQRADAIGVRGDPPGLDDDPRRANGPRVAPAAVRAQRHERRERPRRDRGGDAAGGPGGAVREEHEKELKTTMAYMPEYYCGGPGGGAGGGEEGTAADSEDAFVLPRPFAARPRLGARILAKNNFAATVNPTIAEMGGWQEEHRARAATLLRTNIVLLEENATQHTQALCLAFVNAMRESLRSSSSSSSSDSRATCDERVAECCRLLGRFVRPDEWLATLLDTLGPENDAGTVAGALAVLAACLSGASHAATTAASATTPREGGEEEAFNPRLSPRLPRDAPRDVSWRRSRRRGWRRPRYRAEGRAVPPRRDVPRAKAADPGRPLGAARVRRAESARDGDGRGGDGRVALGGGRRGADSATPPERLLARFTRAPRAAAALPASRWRPPDVAALLAVAEAAALVPNASSSSPERSRRRRVDREVFGAGRRAPGGGGRRRRARGFAARSPRGRRRARAKDLKDLQTKKDLRTTRLQKPTAVFCCRTATRRWLSSRHCPRRRATRGAAASRAGRGARLPRASPRARPRSRARRPRPRRSSRRSSARRAPRRFAPPRRGSSSAVRRPPRRAGRATRGS